MRDFGPARRLAACALFLLLAHSPAHAAESTRTYLDGTGATKQACTGSDVSGAPAAGPCDTTGVTLFDVNGAPITPALDGSDASGISPAAGGIGIRGWLSTIAKDLAGTLAVQLQPGANSIGAVTQSDGPWTTTDAADGGVSPGPSAAKSILGGLVCNNGVPTPSGGQQAALQGDANCRLLVASSLASPNVVTVNPANTIAAYSVQQCLGGLMTFANALPTGKGAIDSVELYVASGDAPVVTGTLYLFDSAPGAMTMAADHAGTVIASADMAKVIGAYTISTAADPSGASTPAVGSSSGAATNSARKLVSAGSSTVYGIFVIDSTTTFSGAHDVVFRLKTLAY